MATTYVWRMTVEGACPFPLDMLRHDQCWPTSSEDAAKIAQTYIGLDEAIRITVTTTARKGIDPFTLPRWRSFGWYCIGDPKRVL